MNRLASGRIWVLGLMPGSGRTLFPRLPFFLSGTRSHRSSRILVETHLVDADFRKAWMPFFCRFGHPGITVDQSLGFGGHLSLRNRFLDLPRITGRDLQRGCESQKSLLLVVSMVGLGMRLRLFHFHGSLVWPLCWSWWSPLEFGLKVCWMPNLL